jgi:thioredoxin 1
MNSDNELEKIKQEMLRRMMNLDQKPSFWIPGQVIELDDSNFHNALTEADKPLLVDFWADWCGPCKMMAPVIQQMALDYTGRVYFAKLNVDYNKRTAAQFGVMSIPYFIVFKNGKPIDQVVGAVGKQGLDSLLRRAL